jgi:hypothetical protein
MIVPKQSECDKFYGNPRGANGHASAKWEAANLIPVIPPFKMFYADKPIKSIRFHKKAANALSAALQAIWLASGKSQAKIDEWGVSTFGGAYNYRLMRQSNRLSMHSYGCAIDLAPERFPMGKADKKFVPEVIKAFADQGAVNLPRDRMHFQFAIVD